MKRLLKLTAIRLMAAVGHLPLPLVRGLGWALGKVLYVLARDRKHIARTNWRLCFPHDDEATRDRAVKAHFVAFAQALMDRGWLWHASRAVVSKRLRMTGRTDVLQGTEPVVVFAPHFVGLDAGWSALTVHLPRHCCGLYAPQSDAVVDDWMAQGRKRFGDPQVIAKWQGLKPLAAALRSGKPLYLLPDMDHNLKDSVWAPFFGHQVATLTSLPRFATLGRAKVVPVLVRMTPQGYDIEVLPPWDNYPTGDVNADVVRMNRELEKMIAVQPEQYYWVHKRFKTRPLGEPSVYG